MAEASRRRVSYGQLEHLWEFLSKNKAIATGYNKTSQARAYSKRMWENIAHNLNSHGDGATKDWKGWCKYWNDYKSKLKKLAATHRTSHHQTGGGAPQSREMTEIEIKFLGILGEDFGSGLTGKRVELFDESRQEISEMNTFMELVDSEGSTSILNIAPDNVTQPGPSTLVSSPCTAMASPTTALADPSTALADSSIAVIGPSTEATGPFTEMAGSSTVTAGPPIVVASPCTVVAGPSIAVASQSRVVTPPLDVNRLVPAPPTTPRRTPRRRRRRDPPITQDAARRALISISERRAESEERRNEILNELLGEIREIKEILRFRFVEHPTDEL